MATKSLLVELLVEELPPKVLKKLGVAFSDELFKQLNAFQLTTSTSKVEFFASPRRLAAWISDVLPKADDQLEQTKLMPRAVAFDALGKPTAALLKKAQAKSERCAALVNAWPEVGSRSDKLFFQGEGKDEALFFETMLGGTDLQLGLQFALKETIAKLPIPKVMTYQLADGWSSVQFVRPAHRLVALHGADVMSVSALGLRAGRITQGHRFESAAATIEISDADSYATKLENAGAVIPGFEKRRAEILRQLTAAAAKEKLTPIADDALLDEVTALVERPNVLLGQFEKEFLNVPQECLILTMKANQKYFPLLDASGKLTNKFLIVSNIRPADASKVISGNERVVRPRLADAKFFFDQDRKKTLESRVEGLSKVVYHNKLGTQGERVERVRAIAKAIGQQLGGNALAAQADQAAMLAKADLLTNMVGEFPELQGIMGRYYAQHDGLSNDIAFAIEDHYKPRFSGDELPRNRVGICVALADKLETLVGMFSIGQIPTGDKDPFALRRHALGIIRILLEGKLDISLGTAIRFAERPFQGLDGEAYLALEIFVIDRLTNLLREQDYSAQEVSAVCSRLAEFSIRRELLPVISDLPKRLAAARAFAPLPEAAALAAANKRVGNILKKAEGDFALRLAQGDRIEVNADLLQEPAEQALHKALSQIAATADALFVAGDYTASLQTLAALRVPVDAFFDSVMVNTEDASLRTNRLALLKQLHAAMNRVADISKLAA